MNKTLSLSLSLSLSLLSGTAFAVPFLPPGTVPEPYTTLPANLTKGVNVSYIAGNAGWWHVNNLHPYDADRINDLLTLNDLNIIKAAGFNHIRFQIDPACVGADPTTGTINPNTFTSPNIIAATGRQSSADQNIQAIRNTIEEALLADIAIIIDLHPNYLSEIQRRESYDNSLDPAHYVPYNSIFKSDLVLKNGILTPNHPLARFWDSFLDQIAPPGSPADVNPGKVYFELMNEPLIEFAPGRIGPTGNWQAEWKPWFDQAIANWKEVQLNALQVCLAKKPNHRFIVSTAMADTADFGDRYLTGNGNWAKSGPNNPENIRYVPSFGNRYTPSQLGGIQNLTRVIYTAHLYSPFSFTHYNKSPHVEGLLYDRHPDLSGQQRDAETPVPEFWDSMNPRLSKIGEWIGKQSEVEVQPGLALVSPPAVMLTEMGVDRRTNCLFNLNPTPCPLPPISYDWKEKNILNDAFVWHWDAREKIESMGVGWTVYEWVGQMGVSKTDRPHVWAGPTRRIHGHATDGIWALREEFAYALFKQVYSDAEGNQVLPRGGRDD